MHVELLRPFVVVVFDGDAVIGAFCNAVCSRVVIVFQLRRDHSRLYFYHSFASIHYSLRTKCATHLTTHYTSRFFFVS